MLFEQGSQPSGQQMLYNLTCGERKLFQNLSPATNYTLFIGNVACQVARFRTDQESEFLLFC